MPQPHPSYSWTALGAALGFGVSGVLMIGLQPILLDQLVIHGLINLDSVGILAMAEIIAMGGGITLANLSLKPRHLRRIALFATLLLSGLNVLTPVFTGLYLLLLIRTLAGFVSGVLVWITTLHIVRVFTPERLAGIYLVTQTLMQTGASALLAIFLIPRAGLWGGFGGLAAMTLIPLTGLLLLHDELPPLSEQTTPLPPFNLHTISAALLVIGNMSVIGAVWAFLEALGRVAGLDNGHVQSVISLTLLMQVAGGIAAAWLSPKLPVRPVLLSGSLLFLGAAWGYGHLPSGQMTVFAVLCAAFGFIWLFLMPFQVRLAFTADSSGRLAQQVPALQLLGSALGPLVASLLINGNRDVAPVSVTALGFAVLSLISLLPHQRHPQPIRY